jgi:hypothetical protein
MQRQGLGRLAGFQLIRRSCTPPSYVTSTHTSMCTSLCTTQTRPPRAYCSSLGGESYACMQCAQERPHLRWARTVQSVCGELICYGWNDKFTLLRPPPSNTSDGRTHPAALVRVPEEGTSTRFRLYAGPPGRTCNRLTLFPSTVRPLCAPSGAVEVTE